MVHWLHCYGNKQIIQQQKSLSDLRSSFNLKDQDMILILKITLFG